MTNITTTLNEQNHLSVIDRIVEALGKDKFNILVERAVLGKETKEPLRFCARQVKGCVIKNGLQVSVALLPGGCIAWDLKVEFVVVRFDQNGDMVIARFFDNRTRGKSMFLTKNPI